jgi:hypothetical protein
VDGDRTACEHLLLRFFAAVSFGTGDRPRYADLESLFLADARLIKNSGERPESASVADFIALRQATVDVGQEQAFETEIRSTMELFGNVGHRFSVYAKRGVMNGVNLAGRGAISTQFVRSPDGWRISAMAWDDERPGLSLADL